MRVMMSWTRPCPGPDWIRSLLCLTLLLWTRRVTGLSDFSNYLSRILTSHSAHACDGTPLRLHCPRHSTISIQSAFYGSGEVWPCRVEPPLRHHNHSCAAFTALQKLLSECQSHRDCQLPVNHLLFGKDPCPGTTKYLHVEYKCKPECLNHEALHKVSKSCYGKQKCAVTVGNQTFRDPCFPGTRKYLTVLYSCAVPQTLLKEADPSFLSSTTFPTTTKDLEDPGGAMMSNSLLTYTYIREHPEMAALLFTSSVCIGLLFTLLVLSVRVTCRGRQLRGHPVTTNKPGSQAVSCEDHEEDDGAEKEDDTVTEGSLLSAAERTAIYGWEDVTYVSEAAEMAERIERREMIIQEIWMNSYLNGSSC
ncbi:protein eva-1 homolog C isoform X4 [Oryzias latipes]|uniref:protein eva-1 homolog C isoform X4 n=1 Tax=Oryzias latipes TaxID=8090 RepID=UPI0009DA736C|nr:protein eva-1 homolog C isoform X4 [Oryzias latipes]